MLLKSLSPTQLRLTDHATVTIAIVAGFFFIQDLYLSYQKDVPTLGVWGYASGPMCAHKLSEIVICSVWIWFAYMSNHERAQIWPLWMGSQRYYKSLYITAILALVATILATYAWTILNLGTSVRTTNIMDPPGLTGEEMFVWRYYLGAVVVAGSAYMTLVLQKLYDRHTRLV